MEESNNQVTERVFKSRTPKGRAARDIIKNIRTIINNHKNLAANQHINYEAVKSVDGEYILVRRKENLTPLKKYLESNQVSLEVVINWFETILNLFQKAEEANLNWQGVLAESFWVDEHNEIYIVDPEVTEEIIQYRESLKFDFNNKVLLAPEILEREKWQLQSQIYAIASFFYYLLTARPLFSGQKNGKIMAEIKKIKPLEPQIIEPELSTELNQLLLDCLAKDLNKRPNNFKSVIERVQNLKRDNQLTSSLKKEREIKEKQSYLQKIFNMKVESFWFLYRYGKLAAVLIVAISVLTVFVLSDSYEEVIDEHTKAEQVVNYFYQAINDKNINLFKETINSDKLPHIESMIINGYVIERAKNLFSTPPPKIEKSNSEKRKEEISYKKRLFQIKNLKIERMSKQSTPKYQVSYYFVFNKKDNTVRLKMSDQLFLKKKKGEWKINKITGNIKNRKFLKEKEIILQEN